MKYNFLLKGMICATALGLVGCQTVESQRLDLTAYSPVIDVEGQGKTQSEYDKDIEACRKLGITMQAKYETQRKKEQGQAMNQAILGTLAGAVIGSAIGSNNDYHSGRTATTGAILGGTIAASSGADAIDYGREMAKFGPTIVVDRCMEQRGWYLLSTQGFGGG